MLTETHFELFQSKELHRNIRLDLKFLSGILSPPPIVTPDEILSSKENIKMT